MDKPAETDHSTVTKSASKVLLGGIFSLVGGLASNVIVAALYGAGAEMDAYLTALVIPTYFQIVLFWNLSFVLIPVFIETEVNNKEDAWALVGSFLRITTVILLGISLAGSIFSTSIIDAIAPGFQEEKAALAARMLTILIFTTPFTGLSTLSVGIQNARDRFFWPSVAPAIGSLANVIVLVVLSRLMGPMALCWGYLAATLCQACVTLIPVLLRAWNKSLPITDPRIATIGRLVLPLILFGMFTSFSPVVERYFSSGLPDGQIAYMGYASKISNIFVLLLASGIATAIFPSMARTYTQNGIRGLSEKHDFGLRLTFAMAVPTILIVSAVAAPLVKVLFERGAFNHSTTLGVSRIVFAFLLGDVLFRMVGNIFQRSFYVLKDTVTQPLVHSVLLVLYIVMARIFVDRWAYIGLVWAGVVRSGLGIVVLWVLLMLRFPKDCLKKTLISVLKYGLAAGGAYACGSVLVIQLTHVAVLIQLVLGSLVGMSVYVAFLHYVDRGMLKSIFEVFGLSSVVGKLPNTRTQFFQRGS